MRIVTARRTSQAFFLALFVWFSLAAALGPDWWRLSGWPVNWLLRLDPLLALSTVLATGVLYAGLAWALLTMALTVLLGRFFCGWVCPLGALNQAIGWLGRRGRRRSRQVRVNRPRPAQALKYHVLAFVLAAAAGDALAGWPRVGAGPLWPLAVAGAGALALLALWVAGQRGWRGPVWLAAFLAGWLALSRLVSGGEPSASLLGGFLDPLPLLHRSISLAVLPLIDRGGFFFGGTPRAFVGAWAVLAMLAAVLLLNLHTPRFFCRYLCPLGALMGLAGRWAPLRLSRNQDGCKHCLVCEAHCEGACAPSGELLRSECVLCLNCLDGCRQGLWGFGAALGPAGERPGPDLDRRWLLGSLAAGVAAAPALRLSGGLGRGWNPAAVRPPGSLAEADFLARCTRCGQCMRVCPSGVIQPAVLQAGLEGFWTPVLDFRRGRGGCLINCVACGQMCPTAAIMPLTRDQRLGRGEFAAVGPVRMGTAFLDRSRCLPWAMDQPCIVCQENCPVSPKAIFTRTEYRTLRGGGYTAGPARGTELPLNGAALTPGSLAGGDYFALLPGGERRRVVANTAGTVTLEPGPLPPAGARVALAVRLQKPYVDPRACIGCGACTHECPVSGLPAIRVSAENETRAPGHGLTPGRARANHL